MEKTLDCSLLPPKDATPTNFAEKTFANIHKTSIFVTIFFLDSFLLYGVCIQPCSTVNDRSWVEEGQGVKLVALPFSYSPELTACWLEDDRLKMWPAETHDKYSLHVADVQSTWLRSWISFWTTYLYSGSSSSFIWREGRKCSYLWGVCSLKIWCLWQEALVRIRLVLFTLYLSPTTRTTSLEPGR